jgi:hypothetical protein
MKKSILQDSQLPLIIEKYIELQDLGKTAVLFDVCLETLRKFLILHNVEYKKRKKYTCNHNAFTEDSEDGFYWAGFLAADGNISKLGSRISLSLKSTDDNHLIKFKNFLKSDTDLIYKTAIDNRPEFKTGIYHKAIIRISSLQIKQDLLKFNICPNKSKTYYLPNEIINHKFFNHFIRGIIDGDGSIKHSKGNNSGVFSLVGTSKVTQQIFDFLKQKLNLESGNTSIREDGLGIFCFTKLADIQKILNYLDYSQVSLDRKRIEVEALLNSKPRKIPITAEMLKDCKNFADIYRIAEEQNVSSSVIRRGMKELNIPFIPQVTPLKMDGVSKEQLIEDIKKMPLYKVCEKYDVVQITMHKMFKKLDINYNDYLYDYKWWRTKEEIQAVYDKNPSIRGIARELEIDRETAKGYLKRYKIIA